VISCGANVPFADPEIFFGPTGVWADERVAVIPDFIANCGMARVFAYLMSEEAEVTDQAIFADVSETIHRALERSFSKNKEKTKLSQTSYEIALAQLM
jgi:glutamate dehydrogenase/leucine dehydrogenase